MSLWASMLLKERKVLITGGQGFLGKFLADRFQKAGAKVFAPPSKECDLTQREEVKKLFSAVRPEVVVHAAGFVGGIHFSRLFPTQVFLKNLLMACHILEMTSQTGVEKLVNIGSACVYSDQLVGPFKEAMMLEKWMHPSVQYYGFSKLALYLGGRALREQFNIPSIHLVLANLYGPGDKFDPELSHVVSSMIPKFVDAAKRGLKEVVCWGSGKTVREFLYVEDCADAILKATQMYSASEPLNIGSGYGITIKELAEQIKVASGFQGEIVWDTTKPDGAGYKVVDISKMKKVLEWEPKTNFKEGLQKSVDWFGHHYEDWKKRNKQ